MRYMTQYCILSKTRTLVLTAVTRRSIQLMKESWTLTGFFCNQNLMCSKISCPLTLVIHLWPNVHAKFFHSIFIDESPPSVGKRV